MISKTSAKMSHTSNIQTFRPHINYEEFKQVLDQCEENEDSSSPYKVSFFNRSGIWRPTWDQLMVIIKYQSEQIHYNKCHLNEIYLPDTPVKLCIDVDTVNGFSGDVKTYETKILKHITDTIEKTIEVDNAGTLEVIYNSSSGHARVYTNLVILAKHRSHFHELLQTLSNPSLKKIVKFDGNSMMRSLFSYKIRSQTDEEKSHWIDPKEGEYKVTDIEKGCYTKLPGKHYDLMVQYSGFVPEGTKVLNINEDYLEEWNVTKIKDAISHSEIVEKVISIKQISEDKMSMLLSNLDADTDGKTWKGICQALTNLGANEQQVNDWSSSSEQYDDKAKSYIHHIQDPNNRYPYGWKILLQNIPDNVAEKLKIKPKPICPIIKFEDEIMSYQDTKTWFEKDNFKCLEMGLYFNTSYNQSYSQKKLVEKYRHIRYSEDNEEMKGNKKLIFIHRWIDDPKIRIYSAVRLIPPPAICPEHIFNLWKGFEIENHKLNKVTYKDQDDLQFLYDHIFMLCNKDEKIFEYVKHWIAFLLQNPGIKPNVMILLKSLPGLGKEAGIYTILSKIIGEDYCLISQKVERDLVGNFNSSLKNKLLIVMDEMSMKIAKTYDAELKDMITTKTDQITLKGQDTFKCPSFTHFMSFSNKDFPWAIEDNDRRYFAIDATKQPIPNSSYFYRLRDIHDNKNVLRLFYNDMKEVYLEEWDAREDRPKTEFMDQLKSINRDPETQFIIDFIENMTEDISISAKDLFDKFSSFLVNQGTTENKYHTTNLKFGHKLTNMNIDGIVKSKNNTVIYNFSKTLGYKWLIKKEYIVGHDRLI